MRISDWSSDVCSSDLYPEIAPPQINVTTNYPGADAETVARTVATPIEQEINGVENMLYMSSYSTANGIMQLTVTFKPGTNLDTAQVQVQNRVAIAEPRLPEEVRRQGIPTTKQDRKSVVWGKSVEVSEDRSGCR